MANHLDNKVAAVTGGTRGIGYSIAEALLVEGARVFICGRNEASLRDALSRLQSPAVSGRRRDHPAGVDSAGAGRVDGAPADVRHYQDCRRFIQGAVERFGGLDLLVNNAGIGIMKPVDQLTPEEWDATLETNLSSAFYCSHEAIPVMRRRGGGYIFNISSLAGVNAFAGGAAYNASKFGLNGFSEALMQDVRYDGIRVSYIMAGSVDTGFAAAGSGGRREAPWKLTGEDVAQAVIDLCRFPPRALASRLELRPSQPPRK